VGCCFFCLVTFDFLSDLSTFELITESRMFLRV
jgi:hypothetical protein